MRDFYRTNKMYDLVSLAFFITIILLELFVGKIGLLNVMYVAAGVLGVYTWFFRDNLGLLIICVSLGINASMGNLVDRLILIFTLFIIFIRLVKANKKNEQALMRATKFVVSKWYNMVSILCLFVVIVTNSYVFLNKDEYSMLSILWSFLPLLVYTSLIINDLFLVKLALTLTLAVNGYIHCMMFTVDGVWYGLVETFMIGFILFSAIRKVNIMLTSFVMR